MRYVLIRSLISPLLALFARFHPQAILKISGPLQPKQQQQQQQQGKR
jgi:hypothetical protein